MGGDRFFFGYSNQVNSYGLTFPCLTKLTILSCRSWCLEFREVDMWSKLFMNAVEVENAPSRTPHNTLNALFNQLGGDIQRLVSCVTEIITTLFLSQFIV
jgi:hypothetical protein